MSESYRRGLVTEERTLSTVVPAGVVVVGLASFAVAWTVLFKWIGLRTRILGIALADLFGIALVVLGVGVLGYGIASRIDRLPTTPDATTGVVPGVVFGTLGFVTAGVVASQTFGFGTLGWLVVAILVGILTGAVTVVAREDIGATLVPGVFALVVGALLLGGVLGPAWQWSPSDIDATFTAPAIVPLLVAFCGVLAGWAGATAHAGFGSQGRQRGAFFLAGLNVAAMMGVLVLLLGFIVKNGAADVVAGLSIGPGFSVHWPFVLHGYKLLPTETSGVYPAIMGTVWIVIGTVLIAVPLGVGAAIFLTEYAPEGVFTRVVDVATNGLWSTPSVVFGLFGLIFFVPRLGNGTSLLTGILVLSFMLLPLVLITSREALVAVPDEYRDASAALGVSQWQTIKSVVLPAALPGVITGTILGIGRIAGETAPVLLVMAGGLRDPAPNVLGSFHFTASPPFVTNGALLQSASALPYQLYAGVTAGVSSDISNWGTAFVLLLVVLSFYAVGIAMRAYFRRTLRE